MKKIGLLPKLILGIIAGIIIGLLSASADQLIHLRLMSTFSSIFGNFLSFMIPCIIIGFVAPFFTIQMGQIMGVMASLGLMSSMLGFAQPQLDLMIALRFAQDSFGTATNVTGDGTIAIIIDSLFGQKLKQTELNSKNKSA